MGLKVAYIAGPYTGQGGVHDARAYLEIERNIAQARELAAELVELGLGFFCPHMNSAHFEIITPNVSPDFWYELDLRFLPVCDVVVLLPGWERSPGTRREIEKAKGLRIPIVTSASEARRALEQGT